MSTSDIIALVTFIVLLLGAIGGIYKYLVSRMDKRPKLKLSGRVAYIPGETQPDWYIVSVTNLRNTLITIQHVGLDHRRSPNIALIEPFAKWDKRLPFKLEKKGDVVRGQMSLELLEKALQEAGHTGTVRMKIVVMDGFDKNWKKRIKLKLGSAPNRS